METAAPLSNRTVLFFTIYSIILGRVQITLSVGNGTSGAESGGSSARIAHDASAEDVRLAITNLVEESLEGHVGDLLVSRESSGAEGLQAYR